MSEKYEPYSMIIEWSDEDDAFIVTIPELSGCRTHGATYEEAAKHGQEVIEGWIDAARADGDEIPPAKTFSYWSPFKQTSQSDAELGSTVKR